MYHKGVKRNNKATTKTQKRKDHKETQRHDELHQTDSYGRETSSTNYHIDEKSNYKVTTKSYTKRHKVPAKRWQTTTKRQQTTTKRHKVTAKRGQTRTKRQQITTKRWQTTTKTHKRPQTDDKWPQRHTNDHKDTTNNQRDNKWLQINDKLQQRDNEQPQRHNKWPQRDTKLPQTWKTSTKRHKVTTKICGLEVISLVLLDGFWSFVFVHSESNSFYRSFFNNLASTLPTMQPCHWVTIPEIIYQITSIVLFSHKRFFKHFFSHL